MVGQLGRGATALLGPYAVSSANVAARVRSPSRSGVDSPSAQPSLPSPAECTAPSPFRLPIIYHPIPEVITRKNKVLIIVSLLCEPWVS